MESVVIFFQHRYLKRKNALSSGLSVQIRSDSFFLSHTHTPHILMPRLYPLSQSLGSW